MDIFLYKTRTNSSIISAWALFSTLEHKFYFIGNSKNLIPAAEIPFENKTNSQLGGS